MTLEEKFTSSGHITMEGPNIQTPMLGWVFQTLLQEKVCMEQWLTGDSFPHSNCNGKFVGYQFN